VVVFFVILTIQFFLIMVRRARSTVLLLLFFISSSWVYGQQDAQFSQYMFNTLFYNPAYAGVEGLTSIQLVARTQWTGFSTSFDGGGGNPNTQIVSFNAPILKFRSGFGLYVLNDKLGHPVDHKPRRMK